MALEKFSDITLTVWNRYGTKYSNDACTRDVDSVFRCSRDLWWIALGDVRTGRVTSETTEGRDEGLNGRGSLFFCVRDDHGISRGPDL